MLRPFVPAKDHDKSRRFYEALGFATDYADTDIAIMSNGGNSFILQNFYVKDLAENFMVQLSVDNPNAWWAKYSPADVAEKFGTKSPAAPSTQTWGLIVGFIHDPSGVLWHITETLG
jgi:predicted lactoylglutathione lyase